MYASKAAIEGRCSLPLPKPRRDEKRAKFIDRCMSNETMKKDFPKDSQRIGVCFTQWRKGPPKPRGS